MPWDETRIGHNHGRHRDLLEDFSVTEVVAVRVIGDQDHLDHLSLAFQVVDTRVQDLEVQAGDDISE